jgi:hypothetical protein
MLMVRNLILAVFLFITACAPASPPLLLPENCRAELAAEQLVARHWLAQSGIWRLRQGALLEIGPKKMPLEGFLRLDLKRQEARLLAMNEMGVVLFDLQVTADGEQMHRAIPQLQQVQGLARGVAKSLRQVFLLPQPEVADRLENFGNSQQLWRPLTGGKLRFVFDCQGDLRETRLKAEQDDWRVVYDQYRPFGKFYIPMQMVMNDYRHGVKLSLWIREVKQEQ